MTFCLEHGNQSVSPVSIDGKCKGRTLAEVYRDLQDMGVRSIMDWGDDYTLAISAVFHLDNSRFASVLSSCPITECFGLASAISIAAWLAMGMFTISNSSDGPSLLSFCGFLVC